MNLVTIEAPASGVAAAREAFEFLDTALGVVNPRESLQVVADQLIKTLAKGGGLLPRSRDNLFIYR
jgi:hypothetical protein